MKNPNKLALIFTASFAVMNAKGAELEINIIPTVGCALGSPNAMPNQTNIMAGLQNLPRVSDWTTAPSFRPFDYLKWPTIVSSTNSSFRLWLGSPNPGPDYGPSFTNEMGNSLDWCTTIFSRDGSSWETKDIYFSIVCSYSNTIAPLSGNLVGFGTSNQVNFSSTAIGVNYDQFGNPIVYTNGQSPTTPIQDFYYLGPRTVLTVGSQADLDAARSALTTHGFTVTYTVWHQLADGSRDAQASATLLTDAQLSLQKTPGALVFMVRGQPGVIYTVQQSSKVVAGGSWITLASDVTEGRWFTNQFIHPQAFFRTVTQ